MVGVGQTLRSAGRPVEMKVNVVDKQAYKAAQSDRFIRYRRWKSSYTVVHVKLRPSHLSKCRETSGDYVSPY